MDGYREQMLLFMADVLHELTDHDGLFRYPLSEKVFLPTVFKDVAGSSIRYVGEVSAPDERHESGADYKYQFKTEVGKSFFVYERSSGEVWIDVSRLDEGEFGGRVYAAVGNYAFNANKVFIGDPAGLSEAAVVRRTSAMLSLVLRFSSADFIEASIEQIRGIPDAGIASLRWRGNYMDKVLALLDTFVQTTTSQFTGIEGYHYDFDKRCFIDRMGRPAGYQRLDRGAGQRVPRAARAGEATTRRIIFLQSLASSQSGERPDILGNIQYWGRALVKSPDLFRGMF